MGITMRTSRKDRRSERVPATRKLILTILGPSGAEILKEIITTVEISKHGARVRGRRTLQSNWKGNFVQLDSGRQAPVRVVWQVKPEASEYMESGLEILADFDFWDRAFANPDAEPQPVKIVIEDSAVPAEELLQKFKKSGAFQAQSNEKVLETVWSVAGGSTGRTARFDAERSGRSHPQNRPVSLRANPCRQRKD